jgi:hypothetical protein
VTRSQPERCGGRRVRILHRDGLPSTTHHKENPMANQQPMDNKDYDLVSVVYHASQGAETADRYLKDAQKSGDDDLKQYLEQVRTQYVELAQQGKKLLKQRLQ